MRISAATLPGRSGAPDSAPRALAAIALAALCASALAACGATHAKTGGLVAVANQRSCPGGAWAKGVAVPGAKVGGSSRACPYRSFVAIGTVGEGVMRQPEALAIGSGGRVYVGDQFTHKVQMFSASGRFEGQWGSFGTGPGQFGAVGGLATNSAGDVYLVDCGDDRVEEFTPQGRFLRSFGRRGSGVGEFDFGAGNGPSEPPGGGIAVSDRYIFVSDTRNNRIERFNLSGGEARVIAAPGSGPGQVLHPNGLAVVAAQGGGPETLYVADDGNVRVQALSASGRFLGAVKSFPATPAQFQNPYDVAVHGGRVYVVDDNHGRIVVFDRALHYLGAFGGEGSLRLTPFIRAVAVAPSGTIYVADAHGNQVLIFNRLGRAIGRFGISANDAGELVDPVDVAVRPNGEGVAVEPYGGLLHLRGMEALADSLSWSAGGEVYLGSLWFSPHAAAFASDGTLWATDVNNDVVRHLTYSGRFISATGDPSGAGAVSAASRQSYAAPSEPSASGGPVLFAKLRQPGGVAVLGDGSVIVADTGERTLLKLSPSGRPLGTYRAPLGGSRFVRPEALAAAPDGTFYLADPGAEAIDHLSEGGRLLASRHVPAIAQGRENGAGSPFPTGLAVGREGNLFVADGGLDRIEVRSPSGALLAVFGSEGSGAGQLSAPAGLAIDCQGNLLVADAGNNRIAVFIGAARPGCPPAAAADL